MYTKIGLITLLSCLSFSQTVSAQNQSTSWQGIYLGLHAGGAWNDTDWHFLQPNYFNTIGTTILGENFGHDDSSFSGGGHVGFNYKLNNWLLGIEGALTETNLKDEIASPYFPALDTFSSKINWYSTFVGRLGYSYNQWLAFITGGFASGETELAFDSATGVHAESKFRSNGWTLGAGFEYQLKPCLLLGVSYRYIDLNKSQKAITCPSCGVGAGLGTPLMKGDINIHSVSARISYLFNV